MYKQKPFPLTTLMIILILGISLVLLVQPTRAYASDRHPIEVKNDLGSTETYSTIKPNRYTLGQPNPTNLLLDKNGNNKKILVHNNQEYNLAAVEITRYRQSVTIEYYLGDLNSSSLIGTDEGYADYLDQVDQYIMTIPQINDRFSTNISASDYAVVMHRDSTHKSIEEYNGINQPIVVKALVGKLAGTSYNIKVSCFQNKQNVSFPNPVGLTRAALEATPSSDTTPYWKTHEMSGSLIGSIVIGTRFDITDYFSSQCIASYLGGPRVGTLSQVGYFDNSGTFVQLLTGEMIIDENTPTTIYLAGMYDVNDLGAPYVGPNYVLISEAADATITFTAKGLDWKTPSTTEVLRLDVPIEVAKLAAYPFDATGDVFNAPEYIFDELDNAFWESEWMTAHRLSVTYLYEPTPMATTYAVTFIDWDSSVLSTQTVESGFAAVAPTDPMREGYVFAGWDKDFTNITSNLTVQALYNPISQPTPTPDQTKPPVTSPVVPKTKDAKTDGSVLAATKDPAPFSFFAAETIAFTCGVIAAVSFRKKRMYLHH